jgi:hypothetical protein
MQDYGGPIGNRLINEHPDWLQWQVIQKANSYEEGFTKAWGGIRRKLWTNRNAETEAPLEVFLRHDTVKAIYTTGHPDPSKISPDNWKIDLFFLARPNAHRVRLDLFYDYRTNATCIPDGKSGCTRGPAQGLVFWGQGDIFFTPEGGEAYRPAGTGSLALLTMWASASGARVDRCLAGRPAGGEELSGYEPCLAWSGART